LLSLDAGKIWFVIGWSGSAGRVSAQHLVRTDSREQKLDAFLVSHNSAPMSDRLLGDDSVDFVTTSVTDTVSSVFFCTTGWHQHQGWWVKPTDSFTRFYPQ